MHMCTCVSSYMRTKWYQWGLDDGLYLTLLVIQRGWICCQEASKTYPNQYLIHITIWCELYDQNMHIFFQVDHFKDCEPGGHMMWWSMLWLLMPWGYEPGHLHPQSWFRCPLYPSNITNDHSSKNCVLCCLTQYGNTDSGNDLVPVWRQVHARTNISCPFSFINLWHDQMIGFVFLYVCVCLNIMWIFPFFLFYFLDLEFSPLLCASVYVLMFLCAATMMI